MKCDVLVERAEQRNPVANQNRNGRDNKLVDQPSAKETLNCPAAIDVQVLRPRLGKLLHKCVRRGGPPFDGPGDVVRNGDRLTAQDDHGLVLVGPLAEGPHLLERPPAHDEDVRPKP